jgi:hypothetical protein
MIRYLQNVRVEAEDEAEKLALEMAEEEGFNWGKPEISEGE